MSRKCAIKYIVILLLYLIIIISFAAPLSENIYSHILGEKSIDKNGTLWYQWFTKNCILKTDFASLYHTDFIAYPSGKNLLFDLGFPLSPICSIPFQIALSFPAYYNIFTFILMAINGLACFILINYIYKDALSAFIGGLFFSINPYVFYQVNAGRTEQAAIFWIPVFILILLKMKERKKRVYSIAGALILLLTSLSYWYYGVFLFIFSVIFLLYFLFLKEEGYQDVAKNTILLLCAYCASMFLLFFYPVLVLGIYPAGYKTIKPFPALRDIMLNKTPAYFNYAVRYTATRCIPPDFIAGIAVIILLSAIDTKSFKKNLLYAITAGFFFILSMGPYLAVSNYIAALPFMLLYYIIPSFSRLWWPVNCFSITLVCAAILLAGLINRISSKFNSLAKSIFPIILAIIYLFPYYNWQYRIGGWLSSLKTQAFTFSSLDRPQEAYYYLKGQRDCAIIELPFNKVQLAFFQNQIIHGKKVFECPGYAIKDIAWPKEHLQYLHSNAVLNYFDLLFSSGVIPYIDKQSFKTGLKQLYAKGFVFIVLNPFYLKGYDSDNALISKIKNILKKPFKEYPDGILLYRIEDLIYD